MKAVRRPGFSLSEDLAAVVVGLGIVLLALAVTWQARPASDAGSRDLHPKGWPTPLAATVGMPGAWADAPLAAFRDKRGDSAARPIMLGMGWIVAIAAVGAALGGRGVRACLPGAILLLRYCARPPFAIERLSVTRDAGGRGTKVRYVLPRHKAANWVGPGPLAKVHAAWGERRRRPLAV
jgi:hypothetical protein